MERCWWLGYDSGLMVSFLHFSFSADKNFVSSAIF